MKINEFAELNYERDRKHDKEGRFNWEFYAIGVAGEAGELMNLLKKIKRGDFELNKEEIAEETADIITYCFLLLSALGMDAEKTLMDKFEKVNKRLEAGGFGKRP